MNRIVHSIQALSVVGLLAILLALTVSAQPSARAAGNIIKVPGDYPTIQAAVDAATDGDTILVAAGDYKENLSITEGITLSGGWDPTFGTRQPGDSQLDGQGRGRVISITCDISDTVVTVDGFTVQNGNATGLGGSPASASATEEIPSRWAAPDPDPLNPAEHTARLWTRLAVVVDKGLYPGGPAAYQTMLDRVEEQIDRLEISQARPHSTKDVSQQATDCGGGIYGWNASLHLLNSTLRYNIASLDGDGRGGGVCVGQAPPSGVMIAGNTFRENIGSAAYAATGEGGGLYVLQAPGVVIEDNNFNLNTASDAGFLSTGIGGGLVVRASPDAVVRGNQVVRNTANAGTVAMHGLGGGAYLDSTHGGTVENNVIRENLAAVHGPCAGGGLMVNDADNVLISNNEVAANWACLFQMDESGAGGGGMALFLTNGVSVTGNTVRDNMAAVSGADVGFSVGGGLAGEKWYQAAWITGNTFTGNVANQMGKGWGGGVALWGTDYAEVAGNTFVGNVSSLSANEGAGGGLFLYNTFEGSILRNRFQGNLAAAENWGDGGGLSVWEEGPKNIDLTVDANIFLGNQASADPTAQSTGGACSIVIDGLIFTNNVIADNKANAGVYLPDAKRTMVVNNTLVGNSGAGVLLDQWNKTPITFTNNIVVSHTVGISVTEGATATVSYTLWDGNGTDIGGGGAISHTHPVTGAPAFLNPAADDYRLTLASVARDAGDPAGVPPAPDHDADGVARPQGPAVDIGAYEWVGSWLYLPRVSREDP